MKLFEGFYDPILSINKNMYPCMQLTIEILILKRLFKRLIFRHYAEFATRVYILNTIKIANINIPGGICKKMETLNYCHVFLIFEGVF